MKLLILTMVGVVVFLFSQTVSGFQIGNKSQILTRITTRANYWDLEPALVKAVVKVESNFNPKALNYERSWESFDDSFGLMQISPALAQDYGLVKDYKNLTWAEKRAMFDIENNLNIGCEFMSKLHKKYSFSEAVQMYNVGEYGYISGVRNFDYLQKVRNAYGIYS